MPKVVENDAEDKPEPGEHRYTVYFKWPPFDDPDGSVEEVDVNAASERQAQRIAEDEYATENLKPGWKVVGCIQRFGMYW